MDLKAIWLICIAFFVIAETTALIMTGDNSFSHHVWQWINVDEGWGLDRIAVTAACVWLVGHFGWQLWG